RVLGGDDDGIDANGLMLGVVFDCDLGFAVWAKIVELSALADLRKTLGELVRESDRRRHQLFVLVGGVTEHHALVAGAAGVNTLGNVRRLRMDGADHGASVGVEAESGIGVSDSGD